MSTTRYLKIEFATEDQAKRFDATSTWGVGTISDVLLAIENAIGNIVDCPPGATGVQANPFDITSRLS